VNYRALKFLIDHGEELWPNTPILFGGVEEGRREQLKQLRPNITGIFGSARFGNTLDTIFKIHPDTQQVTVIVGASKTERFIEARIRQASRKFVGRVDFTYLTDLGFDAILGRVADLPPNSIVLFLTLIQDGEGKPIPENALPLISRVSNAPVYGFFDLYVGYGIVGGSVYSIEDRGIRIGKVGVRILAGEKPKDIPFGTGQKHLNLYDWRQLQRWGIAERDLPPGSIVRYRDQTFYEIYKWYIWGGIFLILFEAVLIALLLINRSRRRRAELKLQRTHYELADMFTKLRESSVELKNEITERKQIENALRESEHRLKEAMVSRALLQEEVKHLDRVATMGTLTAAIAHEINQPLTAILSNAQAALRFLNSERPDLGQVGEALHDIVSDDKRAGEVIRRLRRILTREELKSEALEVNDVIKEIINIIHSEVIIKNASIVMDLEATISPVYGDRIQIQQVILNLLVNALDAMTSQPAETREVRISTRAGEANSILVSVSDSGPGIDDHNLEAIFETFYTTKTTGMGMGLPISRSIIEKHNGRIWASNNPEGGATFVFTLPLVKHDAL
jgi:signal transduction histidine kinase